MSTTEKIPATMILVLLASTGVGCPAESIDNPSGAWIWLMGKATFVILPRLQ